MHVRYTGPFAWKQHPVDEVCRLIWDETLDFPQKYTTYLFSNYETLFEKDSNL